MKVSLVLVSLACLVNGSAAYQPAASSPTTTRRGWFTQAADAAAVVGATLIPASSAHALEACPKNSKNCIRTTWTPPADVKDVGQSLVNVLNAYPPEGQADVDKGGYTIVSNSLTATSGSATVEYKSGIGNFAKFLNGGKPFVDDLTVEIDETGVVQVKSASRVGDSDFGVNQKRLTYLASALKTQGWTVPDPTY